MEPLAGGDCFFLSQLAFFFPLTNGLFVPKSTSEKFRREFILFKLAGGEGDRNSQLLKNHLNYVSLLKIALRRTENV